jgi:hypothetical protein
MTDNPYESPHESVVLMETPSNAVPDRRRMPLLGCLLGGCLFPVLCFALLILIEEIAWHIFRPAEPYPPYDFPSGDAIIFMLVSPFIVSGGMSIGMFIQMKIRRSRHRNVQFSLNEMGQIK